MRWQVFVQRRYRLHFVATRQRLRHGWLTWPSCLRLDACLPRQIRRGMAARPLHSVAYLSSPQPSENVCQIHTTTTFSARLTELWPDRNSALSA
jgi:hypothetical protein